MINSGIPEEKNTQNEYMESEARLKKSKIVKNIPYLNTDICDRAERKLIAYEQRRYNANELKDLRAKHGLVKRSSQFSRLDPFLHEGVLKVGGGKTRKAKRTFHHKASNDCPQKFHTSKDDCSRCPQIYRTSLAVIQEKFWIPGISSLLKMLILKCVICRRYQSPPMQQQMANLPAESLTDDPSFTYVGMDYFGPFELKRGRSMVKRYGVILTCLNTRAIHLEVLFSLDTDSCIDVIRRFIARRGKPKFSRSDNGTNLVGAEKELKEAIKKWNINKMYSHLLQSGIDWTFNPPSASHFGGVWERLIRVKAILNWRPLTPISDNPRDLNVLTPNPLLLLKSGETLPAGTFSQRDNYVRRRWRQIRYLADIFGYKWIKEYLPLLQSRNMWLKQGRNAKEGDLVLIVESGPRNHWNLGRNLEVQKDIHDIVRVVKVKTVSSILVRPITKVCLVLETDKKDLVVLYVKL